MAHCLRFLVFAVVLTAIGLLGRSDPAQARPGEHPLEGPGILAMNVSMPLFHAVTPLTLGGIDVLLGPAEVDDKNRFKTWVRFPHNGTHTFVPVCGTLKHSKEVYKFKIKGKARRDGKNDAVVKLSGVIAGRDITGKGTLTEKSTNTSVKKGVLTGTLPSAPPEWGRIDLRLQGGLDVGGRYVPAAGLTQFLHFRGRYTRFDKWKGGAKSGKDGKDKINIIGSGPGTRVTIRGTNDGTTLDIVVLLKLGRLKYSQAFSVPSHRPWPIDTISVGTGRTTVDIPEDGVLTQDLTVTTDLGAVYRIPTGFSLRNHLNQTITGRIQIDVEDADVFPPLQSALDHGAFKVSAKLLDASGAITTATGFTPENRSDADGASSFTLEGIQDVRIFGSSIGAELGGAEGGVINVVTRNFTPLEPTLAHRSKTADFRARSGTYLLSRVFGDYSGTAGGSQPFALPIDGADSGEFPRVKRVTLLDQNSGRFLASGTVLANGGLTLGEQGTAYDADGVAQFTFQVGGSSGQRMLTITSDYGNSLHVIYTYCDDQSNEVTKTVNSDPTDTRIGSSHLGHRAVTVRNAPGLLDARVLLFGRGDLGRTDQFTQTDFSVSHRYQFGRDNRIPPSGGRAPVDLLLLFGDGASPGSTDTPQKIFDDLLARASGYTVTQTAGGADVVLDDVATVVGALDVENLAGVYIDPSLTTASETPIVRPGSFAFDPTGCRQYIAQDNDRVCLIDSKSFTKLADVKIKCLNQAIAMSRDGTTLYVTTSKGAFIALDGLTLKEKWRIDGLPNGALLTSMSLDREGRCAWMAAPARNLAIGVDLLRRVLKTTLAVGQAADFCDVNYDGTKVVVGHRVSGQATLFDLTGASVAQTFTLWPGLIQAKFGSDDSFFATSQGTAAPGDGRVSRIDGVTGALTFTGTVHEAPTGLVVLGGSGGGGAGDRVIVGDFGTREFLSFDATLTLLHRRTHRGRLAQMGTNDE